MAKKCPPGVFCISNISMFVVIIACCVLFYVLIQQTKQVSKTSEKEKNVVLVERQQMSPFYTNPNYIMSNNNNDTYLNPYVPPLRENPFFPNFLRGDVRGGIPINVPTSHFNMAYKQVGILTRKTGKETILALFGRPVHSNRNKWQYYTMTDKNNSIKLPVNKGGRCCTENLGCDEIYSGDSVYIEGYNDSFNVTIYDNLEPQYIPNL